MTLLSQLRDDFYMNLHEVRALNNQLKLGVTDIYAGDYRFIASDEIDQIMQDELESNLYMLGCFVPSFIASHTGLNVEAVECIQQSGDAKALEGLGLAMAEAIVNVQQDYVSCDGYGLHFAHYDGNEHELNINGRHFYAFKVD
jgi:hypothetical protein